MQSVRYNREQGRADPGLGSSMSLNVASPNLDFRASHRRALGLAAIAAAFAAQPALAEPENVLPGGPLPFVAYDQDGNGSVSEQEFNAVCPADEGPCRGGRTRGQGPRDRDIRDPRPKQGWADFRRRILHGSAGPAVRWSRNHGVRSANGAQRWSGSRFGRYLASPILMRTAMAASVRQNLMTRGQTAPRSSHRPATPREPAQCPTVRRP